MKIIRQLMYKNISKYNFRCQELLVKIIRNNGVKIRNCLETNGQFLRENAFINIERKYELQLFCIIDGDRANGCQESSKNSRLKQTDVFMVGNIISSFWMDILHEFVWWRMKLRRRKENSKGGRRTR